MVRRVMGYRPSRGTSHWILHGIIIPMEMKSFGASHGMSHGTPWISYGTATGMSDGISMRHRMVYAIGHPTNILRDALHSMYGPSHMVSGFP